jgi:hypothetical protein
VKNEFKTCRKSFEFLTTPEKKLFDFVKTGLFFSQKKGKKLLWLTKKQFFAIVLYFVSKQEIVLNCVFKRAKNRAKNRSGSQRSKVL